MADEAERRRLTQEQYDADLRELLSTSAGRRFFYRVCHDTCRILAKSYTGNSDTFFNEGRRSIGVFLWEEGQRVAPADVVQCLVDSLRDAEKHSLLLEATAKETDE